MSAATTRTLVTGGAGFIGRYVVERLVAQGHRVRSLGRTPSPEIAALGVETVQGDLADREAVIRACDGVDEVHHIAACVELWHDPGELSRTNVDGTRHVLEACARGGVERLVFTSSASVVFGGEDQEGVDESVSYPRRFVNRYAETKAHAEQLVLEANGRGVFRTLALRPHLVWGPRDTHFIPNLIARARTGRLVQIGDGRNRVDVTYVENLADAHLLAAERLRDDPTIGGRPFFISQGEPVDAWGFVGLLLDRLGLPRPAHRLSYRRAYAMAALAEAAWMIIRRPGGPPLTRFLVSQMARSHHFDISAARRVLGYRPLVSTAEGVDRLVAAMPAGGR
ncbi:MAG: NAD-dependent epimerase/dehydratase family protein [Acidobacteria bacterium]|nr:NAD-dependent epimerase/dehydratase family protein [Acidobacteriota bacterium]